MKKFDPANVLPPQPFATGMYTALDIYGTSGLRMYKRIQDEWMAVLSQPWPSAEESIRESVATINGEYLKLLAEQKD